MLQRKRNNGQAFKPGSQDKSAAASNFCPLPSQLLLPNYGRGTGVYLGLGVTLGLAVGVGLGVAVGVELGVTVAVGVDEAVAVAVGVGEGGVVVAVGVGEGGVPVAVGLGVGVGCGAPPTLRRSTIAL